MATKPTPGADFGVWAEELNTFLEVSLADDGKVKTEALQTDSTAPVADAAVANKKYVDDSQKQQCRMYLGTDQNNLVHDTWTTVGLDTDSYDPDNISDTGSHKITPTSAGYYLVVGQVTFKATDMVDEKLYAATILKNGAFIARGNAHSSMSAGILTVPVMDVVYLDGDDYVTLQAYSYSGDNAVDVQGEEAMTFLTVQRVG